MPKPSFLNERLHAATSPVQGRGRRTVVLSLRGIAVDVAMYFEMEVVENLLHHLGMWCLEDG